MDKKIIGLMLVFLLSFGIFMTVLVFNKPINQLTRAKEESVVSEKNSLVFAWPLNAQADGKSQNKITVFVRSYTNKAIADKPVVIETTLGEVLEKEVVSGKDGKAEFHLTSNSKGVAEITAKVAGIPITQKVTVKFE